MRRFFPVSVRANTERAIFARAGRLASRHDRSALGRIAERTMRRFEREKMRSLRASFQVAGGGVLTFALAHALRKTGFLGDVWMLIGALVPLLGMGFIWVHARTLWLQKQIERVYIVTELAKQERQHLEKERLK